MIYFETCYNRGNESIKSYWKGKDDTAGGLLVGVLSSCVAAYGFGSKTGDGSLYEASF